MCAQNKLVTTECLEIAGSININMISLKILLGMQ